MPESHVEKQTMPTSPETPETPGGPLFTALQVASLSYEQSDRKTMPPCMCFPINAPTWTAPQTCFTGVSIRDVSLTRKVLMAITLCIIKCRVLVLSFIYNSKDMVMFFV